MSFDSAPRRRLGVAPFLTLAALALVWLVAAPPGRAASDASPLVVKIHADWCGTCKRMEPSWQSTSAALGEEARFVVLDVTDAERLATARSEAEALGIVDFFDAHKAKTGTVGILDASGKTVLVFKGELDEAAVRAAVAEAGGA